MPPLLVLCAFPRHTPTSPFVPHGLTVTEVARELGVSRQSVVRGLERAQLALDPDDKPDPFRT